MLFTNLQFVLFLVQMFQVIDTFKGVISLKNIISNLLPHKDCIYIVTDNSTNYSQIDHLFPMLEDLPVYMTTFQEYSNHSDLGKTYNCLETGIIIATSKLDTLPSWRHFRPHINLIIVFEDCDSKSLDHLEEAIYQDLSVFLFNFTKGNSKDSNLEIENILCRQTNDEFVDLNIDELSSYLKPHELVFNTSVKIITAEYWVPYPKDIDTKNLPGLEVDIFKLAAPTWPLNFSIRPPFSWTPMVHEVAAQKADFSLNGHWEFRLLEEDVDFISYTVVETTFLVPRPVRLPLETFMFQSLRDLVWLVITLTMLTVSIAIDFIYKRKEAIYYNNAGMITTAFFSLNTTSSPSTSILLRSVFFIMGFTSLLISTSYSAGLAAIMNVPPTRRPIRTFQDAAEDEISCHIISKYLQDLLMSSGDEYMMKFAERIIVHKETIPMSGACVAMDLLSHNYFQNFENDFSKIGNLMALKQIAQSTKFSFVVAKKSPYFRDIKRGISRLVEHGHIIHLLKHVKYDFVHSLDNLNRFVESSRVYFPGYLEEMQGAFYLLLIGHSLGLVCFCFEVINISGLRIVWSRKQISIRRSLNF